MTDGALLCFHKSFLLKTSVCFALIKDSVLLAIPQRRLLLRQAQCLRNPKKPRRCAHHSRLFPTSSGWGMFSAVQTAQVLTHGAEALFCHFCKAGQEKEGVWASFCITFLYIPDKKPYPRQTVYCFHSIHKVVT